MVDSYSEIDLDVAALTKGLLELIRELDLYLQNLLVTSKPESVLLQEVTRFPHGFEKRLTRGELNCSGCHLWAHQKRGNLFVI